MRERAPVLVTYATRAGSTAGVAEAIGRALHEAGVPVALDIWKVPSWRDRLKFRLSVAQRGHHRAV